MTHPVSLVDQPLDGIGDLELATGGRTDAFDRIEDVVVEHVNADEGQIALGLPRLLDETSDLSVFRQLGDAEFLRIGNLREQDFALAPQLAKLVHEVRALGAGAHEAHVAADDVPELG